ncbi:MAG: hypothetical protein ACF8R7_07185 [Phycisphaerales bacterium JB039]
MTSLHPTSIPTRRTTPLWVAPAGAAALWAGSLPAILLGLDTSRGAYDALNYHLPTIRMLAERFPAIPIASEDYLVVMTPGYHLLVALAARLGAGLIGMQIVGSLFTLALLVTLSLVCAVASGPRRALVLMVPFAVSLYVFSAGVWLLPDNAAWLMVLVILALALRPRVDRWTLIGGGLALCALVMVRQNHIWAAAPLWAAAWLGPTRARPELAPDPLQEPGSRIGWGALALVATLPAFGLLGYFAAAWGGSLVPPVFQEMYRADSLGTFEAPLFFLAVFGLLSAPLASMVGSTIVDLWAWRRWQLIAAPVAAGAAALTLNTTFSVPGGRFSGMWNITHEIDCLLGLHGLSPTISPTMVLAIAFGALMLLIWISALRVRDRWIFGAAIAGFAAAQCASYFVWQRYHEPFVLMLLALMAARLPSPEQRIGVRGRKQPLIGPALLTLLLLALTVQHFATENPAVVVGRDRLFLTADREVTAPPGCE